MTFKVIRDDNMDEGKRFCPKESSHLAITIIAVPEKVLRTYMYPGKYPGMATSFTQKLPCQFSNYSPISKKFSDRRELRRLVEGS
jgi:hypothetical protein